MRRGPGLVRMAARTAVVAGTATAVSGQVPGARRTGTRTRTPSTCSSRRPPRRRAPTPPPRRPRGDATLRRSSSWRSALQARLPTRSSRRRGESWGSESGVSLAELFEWLVPNRDQADVAAVRRERPDQRDVDRDDRDRGANVVRGHAAVALTSAMITPMVWPHGPAEDREAREEDDDPADQGSIPTRRSKAGRNT